MQYKADQNLQNLISEAAVEASRLRKEMCPTTETPRRMDFPRPTAPPIHSSNPTNSV